MATAAHCGNPPKLTLWEKICIYFSILYEKIYIYLYNIFDKQFNDVQNKSDKLKVAYISVYGISCGISTYNEELLEELCKHCEIKVFAEYADNKQNEILPNDPVGVFRCWNRNEYPKTKLIQYLKEFNPDIVHIGHEYGFFPKAYYFTSLVSRLGMYNYPVISTMHSVYEHLDKAVSEACVPNLIIHTESAKQCLIDKGIEPNRIILLPHGTNKLSNDSTLLGNLWNTWNSNYTIFQPGFLFGYKGHIKMLHIVAQLKQKYPDIHYIIQGSENEYTKKEHDDIYNKIISTATELGILDNITVNRGFVSKNILLDHIRTVKCCVLPYEMHPEHNVRGTSGIARLICGTTTPLVTSNVHLFDDLADCATICKDDEEIKNAIDNIFSNNNIKESQVISRTKMIEESSWDKIAIRLREIYKEITDK